MDDLINEQIINIQEDIQLITNPYERAMVRAQLLLALSDLSQVGEVSIGPTGKNAIKNDNVKPITFEEESVSSEEGEPIELEKTTEEGPREISLENNQVIVQVELEDGTFTDLDVTEQFNLTTDYVGDIGETKEAILEARKELASQIATFSLTPVYSSLEKLSSSNDKLMLAYYMQEYGIEEINSFVEDLTDGNYNDVYEFATNDTVGALVADLAKAAEEVEE